MTDGPRDAEAGRTPGPDFSAPPPEPAPPVGPPAPSPTEPITTGATPPAADRAEPPGLSPGRRRRLLPALISLGVIAVVAAVVVAATVVATRPEAGPTSAPGTPSASSPSASPAGNTVEFSTPQGDGTLTIHAHRWSRTGKDTGSPGPTETYLDVDLQLDCSAGELDVEPGSFQVFVRNGDLYEPVEQRAVKPALDSAVVFAGETARGWVSFDLPRGDVTLIFSAGTTSTTALRIPG